jgi:hypothetical protein
VVPLSTTRTLGRRGGYLVAMMACCAALGCSADQGGKQGRAPVAREPLRVPIDPVAFRARPQLLERIRHSVHAYFRFINVQFADEVCRRFAVVGRADPYVNLHGDAHLEQFAVSATDRGLSDFDAATTGPAVLDLMRFMVSLRLAARERGWGTSVAPAMIAFLDAYKEALRKPGTELPEPGIATRLRQRFVATPAEWLARVEAMMRPIDAPTRERLQHAGEAYVSAMREQDPQLPAHFFAFKRAGALEMGIGSAFEEKYLARVEGPTTASDDDVILEVKQVPDLAGVSCVVGPRGPDPFRVIVGQSRLGSGDHGLLGYLVLHEKAFYVQSWRVNYTELRLEDFASPAELVDIARDTGFQLGQGHPRLIAAPRDVQLRRALLDALDRDERVLVTAAQELETRVVRAWEVVRGADLRAR